ncbi:hypothetical protein QWY77_02505 [Thalassotalea ponticola]|uniref:hypothetical protein n=1 Tax=Thalassotalea ponticola TaxID=1523392 RepID=UPI0025B2DCB7|nr:hypothetical protein [Thalassotalea ponticola]MDN3651635.1 hypothetical protein [Thalassotalea ponticola]
MYKSRLAWGNVIFLLGFTATLILLHGISPDDSTSAAGAVGLLIFALLPLLALAGVLVMSAVIKLTTVAQLTHAGLNNVIGYTLLALGWLISIGLVAVCLVIGYLWISTTAN